MKYEVHDFRLQTLNPKPINNEVSTREIFSIADFGLHIPDKSGVLFPISLI